MRLLLTVVALLAVSAASLTLDDTRHNRKAVLASGKEGSAESLDYKGSGFPFFKKPSIFNVDCTKSGDVSKRIQFGSSRDAISVTKYPSQSFSLRAVSGSPRSLKIIRCELKTDDIDTAHISSLPVAVMVHYDPASGAFKGGLVLAATLHKGRKVGKYDFGEFYGFRLINKNTDPNGQAKVSAYAKTSILELYFPNPSDLGSTLALANRYAQPSVLFVGSTNTGRSVLAAAAVEWDMISSHYLFKPPKIRFGSRGIFVTKSKTAVQEKVFGAIQGLLLTPRDTLYMAIGPDESWGKPIIDYLKKHSPTQLTLFDIQESSLILAVDQQTVTSIKEKFLKENPLLGPVIDKWPIITIQQMAGNKKLDIDDPTIQPLKPHDDPLAPYKKMATEIKDVSEVVWEKLEEIFDPLFCREAFCPD